MKKQSSVLPNIRPVSDLRTKYTQTMNEIYQSDIPTFLTKKGCCDAVIMSADTFSKYELKRDFKIEKYTAQGNEDIRCSFCNNNVAAVKIMFAGPNVYICNECIELSVEVIEKKV